MLFRGLPGLEMLTMEMKIAGVFLSRQLSFANVLVHQETVKPSEYLQITYGRAAQLVRILHEHIDSGAWTLFFYLGVAVFLAVQLSGQA